MIDILLLLLLLAYAVTGYRQGLILGVFSLAGFVGGGVTGIVLAPQAVHSWQPGLGRVIAVLGIVVILAWFGQAILSLAGSRIRRAMHWRPARTLDALLGMVASVVSVCLILWVVAAAVRGSPVVGLSRAVGDSKVLNVIGRLVPAQTERLFTSFRDAVEGNAFPRVFTGLGRETIRAVAPPSAGTATLPAVRSAAGSIVKVTGIAPACRRGQEGTGWVVSPQRVVTNAHVVAGMQRPRVQAGGVGRSLAARVVLFDPARDLAVLAVPALRAAPLPLSDQLDAGDSAVVAGFPLNGPYTARPARVRGVTRASGENIYGVPGTVREVYSLYATVQEGNSGGPLLTVRGTVAGVVFAKSLDDPDTGYALTVTEAKPVLTQAARRDRTVPTGACVG